jgi:hypothetical protein
LKGTSNVIHEYAGSISGNGNKTLMCKGDLVGHSNNIGQDVLGKVHGNGNTIGGSCQFVYGMSNQINGDVYLLQGNGNRVRGNCHQVIGLSNTVSGIITEMPTNDSDDDDEPSSPDTPDSPETPDTPDSSDDDKHNNGRSIFSSLLNSFRSNTNVFHNKQIGNGIVNNTVIRGPRGQTGNPGIQSFNMSIRPPAEAPHFPIQSDIIASAPALDSIQPPKVILQEPFEETKANNENEECTICMTNKRSALLVPCGHCNFCYSCIRQLVTEAGTLECMQCRVITTHVVRPYFQ